ncbi:AraC family transcriptional regulator [Flavobacterium microcysteis]
MENLISILTLDELIGQIKTNLKTTDYVVYNIDKSSYYIKLNIPHRANFFCLLIVHNGYIDYTVNDKPYRVSGGDILFSPISETFTIEHISEDYDAKYIFFSADFITQAGFNYKSNDILKSLSNSPSNIIHNEPELFKRLKFSMTELEILNNEEKENYYFNELIWHHFSLLIYEIDNYLKATEKEITTTSREEDITTRFFILLRENFKEHHDVQFYADKLYITRKYLGKVIKKTMLKSTRDIINQVLVIEAKLLLRNHNTNISDVASILKFSDQAVFCKFFKKQAGKTPLEYKNSDLF